jgi:hypothetical protein
MFCDQRDGRNRERACQRGVIFPFAIFRLSFSIYEVHVPLELGTPEGSEMKNGKWQMLPGELGDGGDGFFDLVGNVHAGDGFDLVSTDLDHVLGVFDAQIQVVAVI